MGLMPFREDKRTLINFHICQCLPLIHGDDPPTSLPTTAQINDKFAFAVIQCIEHPFQTIFRESGIRKKSRCHDNLLRDTQLQREFS